MDSGASAISLAGELDISTIPRIENRLFEALRSHRAVLMDLTRLTFIDSSGIGLLIQAHRLAAREDGGRLHTVIAPDSQVDRVFRLAASTGRCQSIWTAARRRRHSRRRQRPATAISEVQALLVG